MGCGDSKPSTVGNSRVVKRVTGDACIYTKSQQSLLTSKNIGLLAQISLSASCSGKFQLSNYVNTHCLKISI